MKWSLETLCMYTHASQNPSSNFLFKTVPWPTISQTATFPWYPLFIFNTVLYTDVFHLSSSPDTPDYLTFSITMHLSLFQCTVPAHLLPLWTLTTTSYTHHISLPLFHPSSIYYIHPHWFFYCSSHLCTIDYIFPLLDA